MAQSKTVAASLFIIAFAAAAASVASAASASDAAATAHNLLLPGSRKLLGDAGKGMIQITTNDLLPASAAKPLTSGRAAGVSIQRQLLGDAGKGMIQITTNDLLPASAAKSLTSGRAAGVSIQRQLLGDAGKGMIQITTNDLLPASAAKSLTSGRAAGVSIQRQLLGDEWFPLGDHDSVKSGIGGVMHRQLISIPDLLPAAASEAVANGMAEVVGFTKKLTGSVANALSPAA